jgi:TPR repeat protein
MLMDALLMLGYLHLDGEGTKRDNMEAVSAMRRASELGSDEARRTLGWMYNTGQFGE